MTTTQTITDQINSFDYYYEMSDSYKKQSNGSYNEKQIKLALDQLSVEELQEVKKGITKDAEYVNRYFAKYFENLEVIEDEETTETTPEAVTDGPESMESENVDNVPAQTERSPRSEIFKNAWTMYKAGIFTSFGESLKASWNRHKLIQLLRAGIAYFSFTKSNGETRLAIGTLRNGNFEYQSKSGQTNPKPELVKYWDIEKRSWRACRLDRLQTFAA